MVQKLRIAFMGTPDFSVGALSSLLQSQHDVVCVYTQPPRPKGRGNKVQPSPVQIAAEDAGVLVRHPVNFKNAQDIEDFKDLNLDVAVVAAYGLILPKAILQASRYGCINIHASILPRWRGAAPIHRAIWAGDDKTGVTLMQMDEGLDTGPMITVQETPINKDTTLATLHDTLSDIGADMIVPCLDRLAQEGSLESIEQPEEGMTYAGMLKKSDGYIDWSLTAQEIDRQIRALNPWPGTWCYDGEKKRLKILQATLLESDANQEPGTILSSGGVCCGDKTILQLQKIQPENKKPMDIKSAMNGGYIKEGDVLS